MSQTSRTRKTKTLDSTTSAPNSFNQICTMRIELRDSDPLIWRQVEVPTSITLDVLHDVIQIAGVVQNLPFSGDTGVWRPRPVRVGFRLGEGCSEREAASLPLVKPAGAEAVPGSTGSASADGRGRSSARAGFCPDAWRAGCAQSGGGSERSAASPGTSRRGNGVG